MSQCCFHLSPQCGLRARVKAVPTSKACAHSPAVKAYTHSRQPKIWTCKVQTPKSVAFIRVICKSGDGLDTKSLQETANLDNLIDALLASENHTQLAQIVAENILSFDQKFWLRVATRCDAADSPQEKERVRALADVCMKLVGTMAKRTEQQLSKSAKLLQDILKAGADPDGEWYLPLKPERVASMRQVMEANHPDLDEALLSNALAYMRKASQDRLDGMVKLLQKVLQLYASIELSGATTDGASGVLNELLEAGEEEWSNILRKAAESGKVTEVSLMEELQKRMETTVLGLQAGSYAQRVQAEFLRELEDRAKSVFKSMAT